MPDALPRLLPYALHPEALVGSRVRAELGTDHSQTGRDQSLGTILREKGTVGRYGHVDSQLGQMLDVRLEALVQQRLAVAVQRDDSHIEAGAEIGDDALEVLERHDPAPVDEMMLLVALRAVDAAEVARIDGLDGEEHGLAPDPLTLEQVAETGGDSIQVSEVVHGVWSLFPRSHNT